MNAHTVGLIEQTYDQSSNSSDVPSKRWSGGC